LIIDILVLLRIYFGFCGGVRNVFVFCESFIIFVETKKRNELGFFAHK